MAFNGLAPYTLAKNRPVTPSVWTRPGDWITITDDPNKVQWLVSNQGSATVGILTTFTRTSGSQNILIDWGDSTTDTISTTSSTTTNHTFTTGGTPSAEGYDTWVVTLTFTGTGVSVLNSSIIGPPSTLNGVTPLLGSLAPTLEVYFGDSIASGITTFGNYFNGTGNPAYNNKLLKYAKFPATSAATTFQNCFNGSTGLARVVMPTTMSSATNFNQAFTGCVNLETLDISGASTSATDLSNMCTTCTNLTSVKFPATLNSVTTIASAFSGCASLTNITLPSLNACTAWSSAFANCRSLLWCRITSFATSGTIVLTSAWSGCTSMQWCWWPATVTGGLAWTTTTMFSTCYALQSFTFPENWNGTTFSFLNCYGLTNVNFPTTSMSNLSSFSFSGCSNLQEISLPTTTAATISLASAFNSCTALSSVTIPSGWTITDLSSTFASCTSLGSVTLPNNAQNSITTFSSTFSGCTNLETVVMPTSATSCATWGSAFATCTSLKSVTLPDLGAQGSVANISMFSGCSSLRSVTFLGAWGTVAGGGGIGNTMFGTCASLKSITLPSGTALVNGSSVFNGCTALQSVTLPTTQSTYTGALTSMFAACPALTTINNISTGLGAIGATAALINATTFLTGGTAQVTSLSFPQRFSKLELQGTTTNRSNLAVVRLTQTGQAATQWTGTSPQINVSWTNMSTAALVDLFTDMTSMATGSTVTGKTIDISSATGAAGLTAADRLIVTSKGWTITG